MSHQVSINFEGLSIQVQSQCEVATHSLCKIDKAIANIKENAKTLESKKVLEYENYLQSAKDKIQNNINIFYKQLEEYKKLKIVSSYTDYSSTQKYINLENSIREQGTRLTNIVNDLTGAKLEAINQMINEGLLDVGNKVYEKMKAEMNGVISLDKDLLKKINEIEDVSLRELVYIELVKDKENKDFKTLYEKGKEKYDELLGRAKGRIIEENEEELKSHAVSEKEISEFKEGKFDAETVNNITKKVTSSITDETIRKQTLSIIIKAIRDRGFIVDTKHNLKIDKEKNVVKLVSKKADGKTAEFEIQLNGKFMYHFDGYEGMACKKDIEPFMEDLKNIYDIKVLSEETIWSNPDKISNMKYQYVNHNKGTN